VLLLLFAFPRKMAKAYGQKLFDACIKSDIAAVRKLLDKGVDVNWMDGAPLFQASYLGCFDLIKMLLDRGAQINHTTDKAIGWTSLMMACSCGYSECIRLLLENGADMSVRSKKGETAIDLAMKCGFVDVVRLLNEVCIFVI
jgi:ankyrin repeat protein